MATEMEIINTGVKVASKTAEYILKLLTEASRTTEKLIGDDAAMSQKSALEYMKSLEEENGGKNFVVAEMNSEETAAKLAVKLDEKKVHYVFYKDEDTDKLNMVVARKDMEQVKEAVRQVHFESRVFEDVPESVYKQVFKGEPFHEFTGLTKMDLELLRNFSQNDKAPCFAVKDAGDGLYTVSVPERYKGVMTYELGKVALYRTAKCHDTIEEAADRNIKYREQAMDDLMDPDKRVMVTNGGLSDREITLTSDRNFITVSRKYPGDEKPETEVLNRNDEAFESKLNEMLLQMRQTIELNQADLRNKDKDKAVKDKLAERNIELTDVQKADRKKLSDMEEAYDYTLMNTDDEIMHGGGQDLSALDLCMADVSAGAAVQMGQIDEAEFSSDLEEARNYYSNNITENTVSNDINEIGGKDQTLDKFLDEKTETLHAVGYRDNLDTNKDGYLSFDEMMAGDRD